MNRVECAKWRRHWLGSTMQDGAGQFNQFQCVEYAKHRLSSDDRIFDVELPEQSQPVECS